MYRNAEKFLSKWLDKPNRKPLLLRGARQVGKSTLIRNFCISKNLEIMEVNLEAQKVAEFAADGFDVDAAVREIEAICSKRLSGECLLFLDEIQEQPKAVNWLRYFYEKRPDLRVVAAGSLLEVKLHQENFQMPVGRIEHYYLGPVTFGEFCLARGKRVLWEDAVSLNRLSAGAHELLSKLLTEYMFVGGMPEAVDVFIQSNNMEEVRSVQDSILQTYREDLVKHGKLKKNDLISQVFNYATGHIGEKVVFSKVSSERSADVFSTISLLNDARVLLKVDFTKASGVPIRSTVDPAVFKLYFLDVGLYNCLLGISWQALRKLPTEALLTKGKMAEQFVAQHIQFCEGFSKDPHLFYWLREKKSSNSEVDFVIQSKMDIYPVEVKSSKSGRMRSLWQFLFEKKSTKGIRFDMAYRKELVSTHEHSVVIPGTTERAVVSAKILNLPLYFAEVLTSKLSLFEE